MASTDEGATGDDPEVVPVKWRRRLTAAALVMIAAGIAWMIYGLVGGDAPAPDATGAPSRPLSPEP